MKTESLRANAWHDSAGGLPPAEALGVAGIVWTIVFGGILTASNFESPIALVGTLAGGCLLLTSLMQKGIEPRPVYAYA